jgi:hypothetical protein
MNKNKPKVDWLGFGVHFFFGAVFGAAIGFYMWGRSCLGTSPSSSITPGVLFVSGGAVFFGILAGCRQNTFWTGIGDRYHDFPLLWLKVVFITALVFGIIWLLFKIIM